MNAKERFLNALTQEPTDRPPVAAVVTGITVGMMEKSGVYWPEAHHDADQLAELAASIWELCQIECIKLPFGMTIEVEALGAPVDFGTGDTLPTEVAHIFNHPDELSIPGDFFDRQRVPIVLEAIAKLRERYDSEVAIVSSIVGPFALAAKLFGFDNLFPWIITNPDYVHQVLEKLTGLAILYANAQVEAGADAILIGEATCSGDLISPNTYRDFIAELHTQICANIPAPSILHICGNSSYHVPHIAETGAAAYSFDEGVDPKMAREHLKGKVALAGYVPTVEALLQGTPEIVYQASLECLGNGVDILAPGCSLPQHTSFENLAAMVQAAHDWGESQSLRDNVPAIIAEISPAAQAQASPENAAAKRQRRERRLPRRRKQPSERS
jgi:MtaA/CmuA family methyltransferase